MGRYAPDPDRFELHRASYQENYDNVAWICRTIAERYPERKILLDGVTRADRTHLHRRGRRGREQLHQGAIPAVAGQINMDFDNVIYWPSYEIALRADLFRADGRHITEEGVRFVIDNLLAAHATA